MNRVFRFAQGWGVPCLVAAAVGFCPDPVAAATRTKADNTTALNVAGSWVENAVPVTGDTALWDNTLTGANSTAIGGVITVGSIQLTNPGGPATITGASALTINANGSGTPAGVGIDLSAASQSMAIATPITLGASQTWQINAGKVLTVAAVSPGGFTVTFKGNGYFSQTGVWGATAGGITLDATFGGTVSLNQANNFTGGVTLNGGTLLLGNATALGTVAGTLTITGGTLDGSVTLTANNPQAWNGHFAYAGLAGSLNLGTGAVTLNASRQVTVNTNTLTVGGAIGDSGSGFGLTKLGAGTLVLSGANTFTGGVTLNAGMLTLQNATALGGGAGTFTIAGGTLDSGTADLVISANNAQNWNGDFAFTGTQNLNLGTGAVTLNASRQVTVNNKILTVGGVIGDGGSGYGLIKAGIGTLTLNGSVTNTFTGGLTVNGGTNLLDFANLATPTDLVHGINTLTLSNGTLRIKGKSAGSTSQTLGAVTQNAGAGQILVDPNGGGGTTLALGAIAADTVGGTLLIGGVSGAPTITTTSSTNESYNIYGGRIVYTSDGGTTVDWAATASGGSPFTLSAYSGYTAMVAGATTDTANDSTGTLALSGNHRHNSLKITTGATLSGAYSLNLNSGGLLSVGAGASTISVGSLMADYNLNGSFDLIVHQYNTGGLTISASIVDNGSNPTSLTKAGPQTLILSGANTFSGGITLNSGTLNVNNTSALGAGALTINGGTFGTSVDLSPLAGNTPQNWNGDFIANAQGNLIFGSGTVTLGGNRTVKIMDPGGNRGVLATSGTVTDGGAGYGLTVAAGSTGDLMLYGTTAYSGVTTMNGANIILGGVNTGNGGFTHNAGNFLIANGGGLGTGTLNINGGVVDSQGSSLVTVTTVTPQNWNANFQFRVTNQNPGISNGGYPVGYGLDMGTGPVTLNGPAGARTITVWGNYPSYVLGPITIGGVIQDGTANALTKAGGGVLIFNGQNTYTGPTTVNGAGGVLRANDGVGLPAASALVISFGVFETGVDLVRVGGSAAGQMQLTNGGNNYNGFSAYGGPVRVCFGTLGSPEALTWQSGNFQVANSGLTLNEYTANNTLDFRNPVSLANANRNVSVNATTAGAIATMSGILSSSGASGGLTKQGVGTLVLSGVNTFQGQLIVSAGVLSIPTINDASANGPLGNSALSVSITGGATFEYSGATAGSTKKFTLATAGSASTFQIDSADATLTLSGDINGAGILAKTGPGTLVLSGANSYTGGSTVNAGLLKLSSANTYSGDTTLRAGTLTLADPNAVQNSTVYVNGGGIVFDSSVGGNAFTIGGLKGAMNLALVNNALTPIALTVGGNNQNTTYFGVLSGGGSLIKTGTGTLSLYGANTFTGGITINGGTLLFKNTAALPGYATATVPVGNGGILAVSAGLASPSEWSSAEIDTLLANANVTFAAGASFGIDTSSAGFTYGTSLTNANAGLAKLGGNMLTLTNANSSAGSLTVNGGTLKLDFGSLATPTDMIASGNALTLGGGTLYVQGKDNSASAQTLGNLTLNSSGSTIAVTNGASSTMNLTLGNTWSRTAMNGGTLNITLGSGGTLSSSPGLTYGIIGPWATIGTDTSTKYATASGGVIADYTGGTAAAGGADLTDTTGQVNYDLNGAGGTAAATFSGNTIRYTAGVGTTAPGATSFKVNGLLNVGSGLWTIGTSMFTIGDTRELIVHTASAANNDITISSVMADNGGGASTVVKTGAGKLTLSATSTYTGRTVVNGGTLAISADRNVGAVPGAFTADSITLNNGATLQITANIGLNGNRGITVGPGVQTITGVGGNTINPIPVISGEGGVDFNYTTSECRMNNSHFYTGDTRILGNMNCQGGSPFQFSTLTYTPGSQIWQNQTGSSTLGGISGTWNLPLSARFGGAMTVSVGNNNKDTVYNGVLSDVGSLIKIGTGTLTMTNNANTFSGTLTVQSGTLAVGTINNASANGPLGNSANAVTLGYTNNGCGTLRMIGTNAVVASDKRFTLAAGGIGVFQIDNAGTTQTLSSVIGGGGALTKTGAGGLIISGTNTFAGPLTVSAGMLGGYYGSASGALTNKSSATLSPGLGANSYGTFTNGGNAVLESGSTLEIDVGGSSNDLLTVGGTMSLNGTLTVVGQAPYMSVSYEIIRSTGALSGTFAATNGIPAGYSLVYYANSVQIVRDPSPIINVLGTNGVLIAMGNPSSSLALGTDFGYGAVGTAVTNTFVVTNVGAATLTLSGAPVVLSGHSDFTVNPQPGTTVASSNKVSFSIVFTPSANLSRTGMVTIASDDAAHTPYTFAIRGGQLNGIWTNDSSGNWSAATNWLDNGIPQGATYTASFVTNITAARTVTNNLTGLSIGNLNFEDTVASHDWTLTGNPITLNNAGNGSMIMVSNRTANVNCVIAGTETLTKAGAGTLSLAAGNVYTGKTVIAGGTLTIAASTSLGTYPGSLVVDQITIDGGTLGGSTDSSSGNNRGVYLGPGGGTLTLSQWMGPFSGPGNLTINNGGEMRLNGGSPFGAQGIYDNTFTGDTILLTAGLRICRPLSLQNSTLDLTTAVPTDFYGQSYAVLGGLKGGQNWAVAAAAGGLFIGNNNKDTTYSGVLSGSTPIIKIGSGTLTFTGANTYSGTTAVNGGTLALAGTSGAMASSSGVTISGGGTLKLDNMTNHVNRVGTVPVTLSGGTLNFTNDAAAGVNYSETVGVLTNASGANVISVAQAAVGQTSTLTFSSLTRTGGTLNFTGTGLGDGTGRCKIVITGQGDGLIGSWAMVNGSDLAWYDATGGTGVMACVSSGYTDIDARGGGANPNINDGAASNVRIQNDGVSGAIGLGAATVTISSLLQNHATYATTVSTATKTLRVTTVTIGSGKEALTIGAAANDGTLTAKDAGGELILNNNSTATLAVNAVIADNTSASALVKGGSGPLVLAGNNTFSGLTTIGGGTLKLGATGSGGNTPLGTTAAGTTVATTGAALDLNGFTLTTTESLTLNGTGISNGGALVNSSGTAATFKGPITLGSAARINSAGGTLTLDVNSGDAIGGAGQNLTLGGSGNITLKDPIGTTTGSVTKDGSGTVTFSVLNTYSGGTTLSAGALQVNHTNSLGTAGNIIFTGGTLKFGSGVNTATLSWGARIQNSTASIALDSNGQTVTLAGDISGGNTGGLAKTGAGTVILTGANAYTGTTILGAGTLQANHATALGNGGDITFTGGSLQFGAVVNNATLIWNARIKSSAAVITLDSNGQAVTLVGNIPSSNTGGLAKNGTGTVAFSGTNAFTGATAVNAGVLKLATAGALAGSTNLTVAAGATVCLAANNGLSTNSVVSLNLSGSYGKMILSNTVDQVIHSLNTNGFAAATGTWGATGSGCQHTNDSYFVGGGLGRLKVNYGPGGATGEGTMFKFQ